MARKLSPTQSAMMDEVQNHFPMRIIRRKRRTAESLERRGTVYIKGDLIFPTVITVDDLIRIIREPPKVKSVVITTITKPTLLKKGRVSGNPNPYGVVTATRSTQALLGVAYEDYVNQKWIRDTLDKEPGLADELKSFVAGPLWNGAGYHEDEYVVRHVNKDQRYLYYFPLRGEKAVFQTENGSEIPAENLTEYLPLPSVARSGVTWRTVMVANIHELHYNGFVFSIKNTVQTTDQSS